MKPLSVSTLPPPPVLGEGHRLSQAALLAWGQGATGQSCSLVLIPSNHLLMAGLASPVSADPHLLASSC